MCFQKPQSSFCEKMYLNVTAGNVRFLLSTNKVRDLPKWLHLKCIHILKTNIPLQLNTDTLFMETQRGTLYEKVFDYWSLTIATNKLGIYFYTVHRQAAASVTVKWSEAKNCSYTKSSRVWLQNISNSISPYIKMSSFIAEIRVSRVRI